MVFQTKTNNKQIRETNNLPYEPHWTTMKLTNNKNVKICFSYLGLPYLISLSIQETEDAGSWVEPSIGKNRHVQWHCTTCFRATAIKENDTGSRPHSHRTVTWCSAIACAVEGVYLPKPSSLFINNFHWYCFLAHNFSWGEKLTTTKPRSRTAKCWINTYLPRLQGLFAAISLIQSSNAKG